MIRKNIALIICFIQILNLFHRWMKHMALENILRIISISFPNKCYTEIEYVFFFKFRSYVLLLHICEYLCVIQCAYNVFISIRILLMIDTSLLITIPTYFYTHQ